MVHEEGKDEKDILARIPLSSTPLIQTSPTPFIPPPSPKTNPTKHPPAGYTPRNIPLAVNFPLELFAVQDEMIQFYTKDDPSKRSFTSLHGFRKPKNIDEYLKLKTKQAEYQAKQESKGLKDNNLQGRMQHGLSKVKKLEDFAKDLSKKMSNLPPNAELQKTLRDDFLIIETNPYKAYRSNFKDWPLEALKEEVDRKTEKMNNDPKMRKSTTTWKQYKKVDLDEALRYKRKIEELVVANYGTARAIARWSKQNVGITYKKLEELRKTDLTVPQKPVYNDETTVRPQQTLPSKKLFSSVDVSIIFLNQRKKQQLIDEEDEKREEEIRKEAIRNQIDFGMNEASLQLQAQVVATIQKLASRPQSPNSSKIKLLPRNPLDPKILKWKSDKKTHILTLLKSNGRVEYISREDALGLSEGDL
ncbi:hypothetical protein Hanom_Chr17g01523891 [Helianthus anomalus]